MVYIIAGETITVRFELDSPMSFDSLVMVRHNQEDTETVLLDYEDLENNLEPDSTGMDSFDVKMPYSDTEIILKTFSTTDVSVSTESSEPLPAETVTKPKEKADFEQIEEIVTEKATGVIKKPILLDTDNE